MSVKNRIPAIIIAIAFFFMGFMAHGYLPQGDVKCPDNLDLIMKMCLTNDTQINLNNDKNGEFFVNHLLGGSVSGFPVH